MSARTKEKFLFSLCVLLLAYPFLTWYNARQVTPQKGAVSSAVIQLSRTLTPTPLSVEGSLCKARQVEPSDTQAVLPDSICTPGVTNPAVTQETLRATICVKGYTSTIRPPVTYTNALKRKQIAEYGYEDTNLADYEEDHLISLELGGDPKDPKNLWPEPHASLNEKDKVENYLREEVCSGRMTLLDAQKAISGNWYEAYLKMQL